MLKEEALQQWRNLYKAPFRYHIGLIIDANGNMVADEVSEGCAVRVRGWGRISSTHGDTEMSENIQDAFGHKLAELITTWYNTPSEKKGTE